MWKIAPLGPFTLKKTGIHFGHFRSLSGLFFIYMKWLIGWSSARFWCQNVSFWKKCGTFEKKVPHGNPGFMRVFDILWRFHLKNATSDFLTTCKVFSILWHLWHIFLRQIYTWERKIEKIVHKQAEINHSYFPCIFYFAL